MSKYNGAFGVKNMESLMTGDFTSGGKQQVQATFKARVDKSSKVVRHRANVVPKWAEGAEGDEDEQEQEQEQEQEEAAPKREGVKAAAAVERDVTSSSSSSSAPVDRRLALANRAKEGGGETSGRRRRIHQAEVIIEKQPEVDEKERQVKEKEMQGVDESVKDGVDTDKEKDELQARRARARQLAQQREKEQEEAAKEQESGSESESGSGSGSSEYETDTDDEEEDGKAPVIKPVFLSKSQRENRDQSRLRQEEASELREVQQKKDKKALSRSMVAENIRRVDNQVEHDDDVDSDAGWPDDEDDLDAEAELCAWEKREALRLCREGEAQLLREREEAEVRRRRNMTDAEMMAEQDEEKAANGEAAVGDEKEANYVKKFYHKGAFYATDDADDIRNRDFSGAAEKDKINFKAMPEVMQKTFAHGFGMKGGGKKYQGLAKEDTTGKKKHGDLY